MSSGTDIGWWKTHLDASQPSVKGEHGVCAGYKKKTNNQSEGEVTLLMGYVLPGNETNLNVSLCQAKLN